MSAVGQAYEKTHLHDGNVCAVWAGLLTKRSAFKRSP